ncbi:Protein STB6 [Nakaseomyces bracarensis]|uniref:Protein STB6 n=1 Tax=Nakaseomyces bracarensis TaxID=273131 RepID=A0ABR4NVM6_9SACH
MSEKWDGDHILRMNKKDERNVSTEAALMAGPQLTSFIFPDARALYNLGIESCEDLNYEEIKVSGFEIYIVEQWIAERKLSALITSYTGNTQDIITAVKVVMNKDPHLWPKPFRRYYEELAKFAQPKFVNKGCIFVTNLSTISSKLLLQHVECGDLRNVWHHFKTNFDLKKLHCTGRSVLLLSPPTSAALNKFSQLFKIPIRDVITLEQQGHQQPQDSERDMSRVPLNLEHSPSGHGKKEEIPHGHTQESNIQGNNSDSTLPEELFLNFSSKTHYHSGDKNKHLSSILRPGFKNYKPGFYSPVVELVTMIQISLSYFDLLVGKDRHIIDGLLCEGTKSSIEQWWYTFGRLYHGIEKPRNEGTLGPTTAASIISLVLSCYYKLILVDCMPAKDPFNECEFRQGISSFQRRYNISQYSSEGCLDAITVQRLFHAAAKLEKNEFKRITKAVKCKFQDISGKGNVVELSNDILTTDMDTLVSYIHYGSLGLLWKGKGRPRKRGHSKLCRREFCAYEYKHGDPEAELKEEQEHFKKLNEELNINKDTEKAKSSTNEMFGRYMVDIPIIDEALRQDGHSDIRRFSDNDSFDKENDVMSKGPSAVSLSSMYCNYDKVHYETSLGINQIYRKEFHRRGSCPDFKKIWFDMPTEDELDFPNALFRSASTSDIQKQLERWTLPFDPSVVRIARDIRKIQRETQCESIQEDMRHGYYSIMRRDICQEEQEKYTDIMKISGDLFHKYIHAARTFQYKYDTIESKQHMLVTDMKELNSLCSKLKYDVKILDLRVRDVEDSIQQFQRKLTNVRKSMKLSKKGINLDINDPEDKEKFDQLVQEKYKGMVCYEAVCVKIISKDFCEHLKKDLSDWISWLFGRYCHQKEELDT